MTHKSIQDQGTVAHCYGCGPDNQLGFQIKSFVKGDEVVAEYRVKPHHCAGSPNIVNGGVITTLVDCHSINAAIANAYKLEGRAIGSEPKIYCVTGNINISFLKPAPIDKPLNLVARIKKVEGKKTWVECELGSGGVVCARAEVLGIRVGGAL